MRPILDTAAFALPAASSYLLATVLGVRGRAPFALAALLLAFAVIVGDEILLSLVHLLTPAALLVSQAALAAATAACWWLRGRPRGPWPGTPPMHALLSDCAPHLLVLAAAVAIALALQAVMAVAVAPNEQDALGYHLPRAAYWLQHETALQYQPGQLDDPELVAPPNAELLSVFTMALSRSDRYVQLVQWLSLLGIMAAIFSIARLLGARGAPAAWAAGLFALMPAPLLEAATAQNDLVITLLLLGFGFFAVRGLRDRDRGDLVVAAIAAGLAVGTKLTVALAIPGAALTVGVTWRAYRPPRRLLLIGGGVMVGAVVALGAFNYVQNAIYTHTLTGFSGTPSGDFVRSDPLTDAGRVGWDLVEAPGLPQPAWLRRAARGVVRRLFTNMHGASFGQPDPPIRSEAFEDESAYGLVGLLVLVPLLLATAVRRRAPPALRVAALAALSYFAAYVLELGYTPEAARYLMPAIALAAPLLAHTSVRRRVAWPVLALALATVPNTLLEDTNKPIIPDAGGRGILRLDRLAQQTFDPDLQPLAAPIRRLDRLLGRHTAIGFLRQDPLRDYLLLGEPLQRRVVGFDPAGLTPAGLRAAGVAGVFIGYTDVDPCRGALCVAEPRRFSFLRLASHTLLLLPRGEPLHVGPGPR